MVVSPLHALPTGHCGSGDLDAEPMSCTDVFRAGEPNRDSEQAAELAHDWIRPRRTQLLRWAERRSRLSTATAALLASEQVWLLARCAVERKDVCCGFRVVEHKIRGF